MAPPVSEAVGSCTGGVFLTVGGLEAAVLLGAALILSGCAVVLLGVTFIFLEGVVSLTDGGGAVGIVLLGEDFSFKAGTFPTEVVLFEGADFPTAAFFFGGAAAPFELLFSRNRVKSFAVAFFGKTFAVAFFAMGVPLHW